MTFPLGFTKGARDYLASINSDIARDKPRVIPSKDAHEGIRPTNMSTTPSTIAGKDDAKNLYKLIWARILASQGKSAIIKSQNVILVDAAITNLYLDGSG